MHEVSNKYRDEIAELKEQIRVLQETRKTQIGKKCYNLKYELIYFEGVF